MISAIFGLGLKTWNKARQASPSITYSNPRPISLIFQDSNHVFYIYSHLRDKTHFSGSFSTQSYRSQPQKMSLHNHFVRDHCTNFGVGVLRTIVLNSLVWGFEYASTELAGLGFWYTSTKRSTVKACYKGAGPNLFRKC